MSFCYVVLCHTAPEAALALARSIRTSSPESSVLLRFRDPGYLDAATVAEAGAMRWVSRLSAAWGEFSLAEAALEALDVARTVSGADRFVVVSGQDAVIRDLAEWEAGVRASGVDALVEPLSDQPLDHRFSWQVVHPSGPLGRERSLLRRAVVRAGQLMPSRMQVLTKQGDTRMWVGYRRPRHESVPLVKAALWTMLSDRAVDAVLEREFCEPALVERLRQVRLPDEWFLSSLVCSDPRLRIGFGSTSGKDFPTGSPNPRWLDLAVLERIRRTSRAPFARKLSPDAPPEVRAELARLATRSRADVDIDVAGAEIPEPAWRNLVRAEVVPVAGL